MHAHETFFLLMLLMVSGNTVWVRRETELTDRPQKGKWLSSSLSAFSSVEWQENIETQKQQNDRSFEEAANGFLHLLPCIRRDVSFCIVLFIQNFFNLFPNMRRGYCKLSCHGSLFWEIILLKLSFSLNFGITEWLIRWLYCWFSCRFVKKILLLIHFLPIFGKKFQ